MKWPKQCRPRPIPSHIVTSREHHRGWRWPFLHRGLEPVPVVSADDDHLLHQLLRLLYLVGLLRKKKKKKRRGNKRKRRVKCRICYFRSHCLKKYHGHGAMAIQYFSQLSLFFDRCSVSVCVCFLGKWSTSSAKRWIACSPQFLRFERYFSRGSRLLATLIACFHFSGKHTVSTTWYSVNEHMVHCSSNTSK